MNVSHILVETLEEALTVKQKIAEGESFISLVQQHSICPSKSKKGDLGVFNLEQAEKEYGEDAKKFGNCLFALEINEISDPVQTRLGYHLIHRTG